MQIITRSDATRQGLKRFYTGDLCKHGHDSPRYVCNTKCIACDQKEDINVKVNRKHLNHMATTTMARAK